MTCDNLPSLLFSFIDTFVDFSVSGGLFLSPPIDTDDPIHAPPLQTIYPQPKRLIAIGDLHGDLSKTKQSLRLASLIDADDRWSGGSTTLVQVGDIFDRGGDELKILYLFEKLKREAARAGGTIITMNGNHEILNINRDFFSTSPEGLEEFKNWSMWYTVGNDMKRLCKGLKERVKDPFEGVPLQFSGVKSEFSDGFRSRIAAMQPGGPISERFLAKNPIVVQVGDSIFAHGGLLPNHVGYGLERANEEVSDWIRGVKDKVDKDLVLDYTHSIVWSRKFSHELAKDCDCSTLEHVLDTIPGVKRMIMGHTIQQLGINGVCGNKAIRIDVGMSKGCIDALPEVLEINENLEVKVLSSNPLIRRGCNVSLNVEINA